MPVTECREGSIHCQPQSCTCFPPAPASRLWAFLSSVKEASGLRADPSVRVLGGVSIPKTWSCSKWGQPGQMPSIPWPRSGHQEGLPGAPESQRGLDKGPPGGWTRAGCRWEVGTVVSTAPRGLGCRGLRWRDRGLWGSTEPSWMGWQHRFPGPCGGNRIPGSTWAGMQRTWASKSTGPQRPSRSGLGVGGAPES